MGQVKDVLVKARDKIAKGWVQHTGQDYRGHVCSVYALNAAASESHHHAHTNCDLANKAGMVLIQAIDETTSGGWHSNIVSWNDYHRRTKDEVLHTFDHAIKLADRDNL